MPDYPDCLDCLDCPQSLDYVCTLPFRGSGATIKARGDDNDRLLRAVQNKNADDDDDDGIVQNNKNKMWGVWGGFSRQHVLVHNLVVILNLTYYLYLILSSDHPQPSVVS